MVAGELALKVKLQRNVCGGRGCGEMELSEAVIGSYWATGDETLKRHSKEKGVGVGKLNSKWEDLNSRNRGIMSLSLLLPDWKRKKRRFCCSRKSNFIEVKKLIM